MTFMLAPNASFSHDRHGVTQLPQHRQSDNGGQRVPALGQWIKPCKRLCSEREFSLVDIQKAMAVCEEGQAFVLLLHIPKTWPLWFSQEEVLSDHHDRVCGWAYSADPAVHAAFNGQLSVFLRPLRT